MQNKYFILDIQKRILDIQNNYFWYPEKTVYFGYPK